MIIMMKIVILILLASSGTSTSEVVRVALDWTPNSNHAGLYVGLNKGWFKEAGIDLQLISPSDDYTSDETPARSVVNGRADLCVAPSESVISCWTSDAGRQRPVVVASLLQSDTSAVVAVEGTGINSMSDLDSKKYASYGGRFEMSIIRQMIRNSGGAGSVAEVLPPKLDCFDSVCRGDCDATWIFLAWEGIIARQRGIKLKTFPLSETSVSYGYSPVLMAHPDMLTGLKADTLRKVLAIAARGYKYACTNPEDAANCLLQEAGHPTLNELGINFLIESQQYLADGGYFLDGSGSWGLMDQGRWDQFLDWLCENSCLTSRDGSPIARSSLNSEELFTNQFLD